MRGRHRPGHGRRSRSHPTTRRGDVSDSSRRCTGRSLAPVRGSQRLGRNALTAAQLLCPARAIASTVTARGWRGSAPVSRRGARVDRCLVLGLVLRCPRSPLHALIHPPRRPRRRAGRSREPDRGGAKRAARAQQQRPTHPRFPTAQPFAPGNRIAVGRSERLVHSNSDQPTHDSPPPNPSYQL